MQEICRLDSPEQHTWSLSWYNIVQARHPNGRLLAVAGSDRKITLWMGNPQLNKFHRQVVSYITQQVISGDSDKSIRSLQFSHCGKFLCSGSFDSTISVYVQVEGQYNFLVKLEGHENEVKCVSWSPNDRKIASCSRDKNIYIWERNQQGDDYLCDNVLEGHTQDVKWVTWIDAGTLVSGSYDNNIRLWQYEDDDVVCRQVIQGHTSTVWSVAIHQPSKNLISISDDATLRVWGRSANGKYEQLQLLDKLHTTEIYSIDIDPTSHLLVTGGGNGRVVISRLTPEGLVGEIVTEHQAHEGDINCVRFHPTAPRTLATSGDDGIVRVWQF